LEKQKKELDKEVKDLEKERKEILAGSDEDKAEKAQEKLEEKQTKVQELEKAEKDLNDLKVVETGTVAAGTYLGKKVIDKFGDTPGNNLNKLGIDHQKQWEEHQRWMTDKNKYIEEKTDEFFKSQKDRLKALEEENKQLAEALEKETDPQKKAQILDQIKNNRVEMKEIRREIADHINQINKNFTEIGRFSGTSGHENCSSCPGNYYHGGECNYGGRHVLADEINQLNKNFEGIDKLEKRHNKLKLSINDSKEKFEQEKQNLINDFELIQKRCTDPSGFFYGSCVGIDGQKPVFQENIKKRFQDFHNKISKFIES
ncbi:21147_t:CDS:2, partial [Racocetra persica]